MAWTADQVLALAPDPGAAKAGRELASERRWANLGRSDVALWGECKGSAAQPYRTEIDLNEPAFKCSCPSRKFPCKHSLGLFLIYADRPASLPAGPNPDWVQAWLDSRQKRVQRAERVATADREPEELAKLEAQAEKRAERRTARAVQGVEELTLWISDLLKEGLAELPRRPQTFWNQVAARMVDAQVPGLARMVAALGETSHSGPGWPERMLTQLGRLQLLLEATSKLNDLEAGLQAEVRAALGFTESKEDVLAGGELVDDRWAVLGRSISDDDRIKVQRTWLRGLSSRRPVLVLDFAAGGQTLDQSLITGTEIEAGVRFYPGQRPVRGLVATRRSDPAPLTSFAGDESVAAALDGYAAMLAASPFFERSPMCLENVLPVRGEGGWFVADSQGVALRLAGGPAVWRILSMSGGRPLAIFGEWDGARLAPLGAFSQGEFANLQWLRP